ncbi:MAG: histidine phosphatase family protein [Rhodobacteraceae bacterium]|nr:histidine phosphatase family protein [Paracoccaceae bacterium]
MKTLIVMRHAKSSWGDPGVSDVDRPLNTRGKTSAKAIGEWLRFGGFAPDLVLCSSARRTAQTWELMGLEAELQFKRTLYLAPPETILAEVQQAHGECLLVLGHNPGIAEFAGMILGTHPTHERFEHYPTAATLVAQFDGAWSELRADIASPRAFTVPRDL